MANKLNGSVMWVAISVTILTLMGSIVWQSSAISKMVNNHDNRIERLEASYGEITQQLSSIQTNVEWLMRNK